MADRGRRAHGCRELAAMVLDGYCHGKHEARPAAPNAKTDRNGGASESRQYSFADCWREHRRRMASSHYPERTARLQRQQPRDQEPVALHRRRTCALSDHVPAGGSGYASDILLPVSSDGSRSLATSGILPVDHGSLCGLRGR